MKRYLLTSILGLLVFLQTQAQIHLNAVNVAYTQNFNTLASTGTTNDTTTVPQGWLFAETGTNANATYASSTGSSNTGNTYSLGLDADRAFGGLQSGSLIPYVGARFENNTGTVITSLMISYTGEQWRLGATPRTQADRLDFQYSTSTSSLLSGTWVDNDSLDFNAPILSSTVGALNGNISTNRKVKSQVISGLVIAPGQQFWIRWSDFNVASSDDALGIDDFSIIPMGSSTNEPSITLKPTTLNFGEVNVNSSKILSYTVSGSNLPDSLIFITSSGSPFKLSLDGVNFGDSLTVFESDSVFVKFSPLANANYADSINHINSNISLGMLVTGKGFDPLSNIIPVADARVKTAGAKVTIAGRVTVGNQQGSPSFVQDATGGIPVFEFGFSNSVEIGDSVIVTGVIGYFNQQVQISNSVFYSTLDSVKRYVTPKAITLNELAANEGLLVTIKHVELVNKAFVFYPQSTETLKDSIATGDLRIDGDTNISGLTKPQGFVDITGVVGRFKTNAQLLPRFREDIPGASEPTTDYDSISTSATFDLMNWNLEFFGARREDYPQEYGPADEYLQHQNVQKVINSVRADVIAVQEVSNDSLFHELIKELSGYKAVCSNRYSYSFQPDGTFPPQKVCFIYDSTTVKVESVRAMFENLYDSARQGNSALLPNYPTGDPSSFWSSGRLPFMLTANVTVDGISERIRFINLHAKSGATVGDYNRRVYDARVLKDSLDAHYAGDKVVILGDYNDDLDESIVTGLNTSYSNFISDSINYNPVTLALSRSGAKSTVSFDGVIDNQIISNELNGDFLNGSQHVITPFLQIPNYGTTTSDHLAVVSRFKFSPVTVRFSAASVSITESNDSSAVVIALSKPFAVARTIPVIVYNGQGVDYGIDYLTSPPAIHDTINVFVPAGSTSAYLFFNSIDDNVDEPNKTVQFHLLPSNGVVVADSSDFTLTILDNDLPSINFTESEVSNAEGSGLYKVRLKLSSAQTTDQSVVLQLSNGAGVVYGSIFDYVTSPTPTIQGRIKLAIPAGKDEIEFTITPNNDLVHENIETVSFNIASVSSGVVKGTNSTFKFNIIDTPACLPVFTVFPNPTFGIVNIYTLPANEENVVEGALIDPRGEVITVTAGTVSEISTRFTTALQGKKRGIYIIRLKECDKVVAIRLIKL